MFMSSRSTLAEHHGGSRSCFRKVHSDAVGFNKAMCNAHWHPRWAYPRNALAAEPEANFGCVFCGGSKTGKLFMTFVRAVTMLALRWQEARYEFRYRLLRGSMSPRRSPYPHKRTFIRMITSALGH